MTPTRIAAVLTCAAIAQAPAAITLIGKASIPGTAHDLSRLPTPDGSSTPADMLGSFGSAIAYTGRGNRFIATDDRGPGNGNVAWRCRVQTLDIDIEPGAPRPVSVKLIATTLLSDSGGRPFAGNSGGYDIHDQTKGLRLDPEGIRVSPAGTLLISDEYGPWIDEFSIDGRQLRRFPTPERFLVTTPDGEPAHELPPSNHKGRQPNHGFEGLALSPDGGALYAILQAPLIQDGALDAGNKRVGRNCRILELTVNADGTVRTREFVYTLESPNYGVNEILTINDHQFLVEERDSKSGDEARFRKLFTIDIAACTDVSAVESLPCGPLPPAVGIAAAKTEFLDFLDPKFELAGPGMPEKIEGLAWGKDLEDGRHTLIVTTDNDLKPEQPSWFWVFAVDPGDLRGLNSGPAGDAGRP
jgi:hypothetical protein